MQPLDLSKLTEEELTLIKERVEFYLTTKKQKKGISSSIQKCYDLVIKYLYEEHGLNYPALYILKKSDPTLSKKVQSSLKDYIAWSKELYSKKESELKIKENQFISLSILFIITTIVIHFTELKIPISLKAIMQLKEASFQEIIGRQFPGYGKEFLVKVIIKPIQFPIK